MTRVICFHTNKFDISTERPNPINPIPGESLLLWLAERAKPQALVSSPAAEDWGWYSDIKWDDRSYMLGSSASLQGDGDCEWVLQVVKWRSFMEKLLGRAGMTADDTCANFFQALLEKEPSFKRVSVDP